MDTRRARIFVSYKHGVDSDRVLELQNAIDPDRFDLKDDTKLRSGDEWHPEIELWLRTCDAAIILVSAEALKSDFCLYEIGVLTHRYRTTKSRPAGRPRFELFVYRTNVSSAKVERAATARPARLGELQSEPWLDSRTIAAALEAVSTYDDERLHLGQLAGLLPREHQQVRRLGRDEFYDVPGYAENDPRSAIALGLFDRVVAAGSEIEAWDATVFNPMQRLSEAFGDPREATNFAYLAAARRIPYAQARALDGVSREGRVFAIAGANRVPVELHLASVGATHWSLMLSQICRNTAYVPVDTHVELTIGELVVQIRRALGATTWIQAEIDDAAAWEDELAEIAHQGRPATIVLELTGPKGLEAGLLHDLRNEVPWTNIIIVTATGKAHEPAEGEEGWAESAELVPLGSPAELSASGRFYADFSRRVRRLAHYATN